MNMLANLTTSDDIAPETDRVGGGGVIDAGVYAAKVKMAYLQKSKGGALGLVLALELANGKELRTTQYMTSGDNKGNKNYYEKDGQKHYLPGFNIANSLAMLTLGKEISKLSTDERLVNIYNKEAKAEKPTPVQVVIDLLGEEVNVGVLRVLEYKNVDDGNGNYVPSADTRESNEIDKFFCAKSKFMNMTTAEIRAKAEKAEYVDRWTKDNAGQIRDKTKGVTPVAAGNAGAPKAGGAASTPKPDDAGLFD